MHACHIRFDRDFSYSDERFLSRNSQRKLTVTLRKLWMFALTLYEITLHSNSQRHLHYVLSTLSISLAKTSCFLMLFTSIWHPQVHSNLLFLDRLVKNQQSPKSASPTQIHVNYRTTPSPPQMSDERRRLSVYRCENLNFHNS